MSTAIDPESMSWMRRVRYTPMRDVLRGRWTGRLNVRARIDRAAIPDDAKQLVARVVKRTRLWPLEKIDVADELIAHFADGLESGTSIDDLIKSFGDETRAAKMIRRAKRRNRPMAWHVVRAIGICFALFVVTYVGLAAYFFAGKPVVRTQYLDALNAANAGVPQHQRGWPLYQQAVHVRYALYAKPDDGEEILADAMPGSARWPDLVRWSEEHAADIELIRQGAARPIAGFKLTPRVQTADPECTLFPSNREWPPESNPPLWNGAIFVSSGSLDELNDVLWNDARVAIAQRDASRFTRNVDAMLGISRQLAQESLFHDGTSRWPLNAIELALVDAHDLLDESTLRRFAHALSKAHAASDVAQLDGYRLVFRDLVQRMYTDDGNGDGRISMPGIASFRESNVITPARIRDDALSPMTYLATPSRRAIVDEFDRIVDDADALLHRPLREADWSAVRKRSDALQAKLPLTAVLMSLDLEPRHWRAERYLGRRDGVVTAMALELYRRSHGGAYPSTLDALVPDLLPTVPLDRIDGQPIRYRVIDGKPRIYSVGVDRDDDGGEAARTLGGESDANRAARWPARYKTSQRSAGDWVLFPQSSDVLDAQTK